MTLTISAKNLGDLAHPSFCPRCFWIKTHCRLPYQIFPSIFGHIDRYTKDVFHAYIDKHGRLPGWLSELGEVVGYVDPPHWSRYKIHDKELDVVLRGEADAIFVLADESYLIGDYKTAKFTKGQDSLLPIYRTQLNAYAYIGERLGFSPIKKLALIYMEPVTGEEAAADSSTMSENGFRMDFSGHVLDIELDAEGSIPLLMRKAKEIYDMEKPPAAKSGCKECKLVCELMDAQSGPAQKSLFEF